MFKLISWIAGGFLVYFIYDVVRRVDNAGLSKPQRGLRPTHASPTNITGRSGQGMMVPVEDVDGAQHRTKVGRGVVS